jgi:hypothetical protein
VPGTDNPKGLHWYLSAAPLSSKNWDPGPQLCAVLDNFSYKTRKRPDVFFCSVE